MYNLANASIYFYSIQRGTPHVNLRQKRASLFNSQILVVALIGIFGGLKPKMCVHFSKDWRSVSDVRQHGPPLTRNQSAWNSHVMGSMSISANGGAARWSPRPRWSREQDI